MSLMLSFVKREKGQSHRVKRSLYHSSSTARQCVRQGQHELSKLRLEVLLLTSLLRRVYPQSRKGHQISDRRVGE